MSQDDLQVQFPELNENQIKMIKRMLIEARIDEDKNMRANFYYDDQAPSFHHMWSSAMSTAVKQVHEVFDNRVAELEDEIQRQ